LSANIKGAKITINGINLPYTEFNGYLFAPINLSAIAPAGYRFVGWKNTGKTTNEYISTDAEYTLPSSGKQNLSAIFEKISEEELIAEGITPVRINEVSAANSMYINDYFKKNDWIELYNTTEEPIDVAGMYLSDNVMVPTKWHITSGISEANTMIDPHGFLIVWCDDLDPVNQLHASFKLAKEGGVVILSSEDQTWTDNLSYPAHNGDNSVGLYPDGGSQYYVMTKTTIGQSNVMNSYAKTFENIMPGIKETTDYHKDITIAYHNGDIVIRSNADYALLNISSISAQTFMQERISINGGTATISVESLPRGIYIVTAKDNNGNSKTIKVMKN
jgi:hypothetical protein